MPRRPKRLKKQKIGVEDLDFLRSTDLFADVPEEAKTRILSCMIPLTIRAGERFICRAEQADCLYLIQKGSCSIVVEKGGERHRVARRHSGELVGEMSIMTGEHRTADVEAETDMILWRMNRVDFEELCLPYPGIGEFVARMVSKRISTIAKPIDKIELRLRLESLLKTKIVQDELKRYKAALEKTIGERTQALQASEARFRAVFEAAQDCMFIKGTDLKYTHVNSAMLAVLQMDASQIIGKTDGELVSAEWPKRIKHVEERVLQGQSVETEQRLLCSEQPLTFNFVRFPLRDPSGEISGICGIAREVTDRPALMEVFHLVTEEPQSAAMSYTLAEARLVADTNSVVLLTGETGSGKDHLARYIHEHSSRSSGPFRVLNCAAVPSELAESELFGHEAGAFTGAARLKRGLIELAEGGTLLLNEVGELARPLQSKLLTFLDTLSFTRVGGEKPVVVNARLMAATNKDLSAEVAEGRFREDLFYRIHVFTIHLPPLRERIEDIQFLIRDLIRKLAVDMQLGSVPEVEPGALAKLSKYHWPGNVRELRNVLERALILSHGRSIAAQHLVLGRAEDPQEIRTKLVPKGGLPYEILADMERSFIEDALQRCRGKKEEAARLLGISRYALTRHMKKFRIKRR